MLYCSDSPPDHRLDVPLLNNGSPVVGIDAGHFQLLVGDGVAQCAGDRERSKEADRQVAQALAPEDRGCGGTAVVNVERCSICASCTGSREFTRYTG